MKNPLYRLHASDPCGHCYAVEQIRQPYCASRFPSSDHSGVGSATDRLGLRRCSSLRLSLMKASELELCPRATCTAPVI